MFIFLSAAISSGSWFIVFSVLTLNVAKFRVCLYLSWCDLPLGSVVVLLDIVFRTTKLVVDVSCLSALGVVRFVLCCWGTVANFQTRASAQIRGRTPESTRRAMLYDFIFLCAVIGWVGSMSSIIFGDCLVNSSIDARLRDEEQ